MVQNHDQQRIYPWGKTNLYSTVPESAEFSIVKIPASFGGVNKPVMHPKKNRYH